MVCSRTKVCRMKAGSLAILLESDLSALVARSGALHTRRLHTLYMNLRIKISQLLTLAGVVLGGGMILILVVVVECHSSDVVCR